MSNIQVTAKEMNDRVPTSYEERSVRIQLISLCWSSAATSGSPDRCCQPGVAALPAYAPVFGVAVALMVLVLVVGHVAAALASRPDGRDERDRLIEWRAESHSGWLLATGVLSAITAMVLSVPNVWVAHLLLLSLFLSEVLKLVLQLVAYRRGI